MPFEIPKIRFITAYSLPFNPQGGYEPKNRFGGFVGFNPLL